MGAPRHGTAQSTSTWSWLKIAAWPRPEAVRQGNDVAESEDACSIYQDPPGTDAVHNQVFVDNDRHEDRKHPRYYPDTNNTPGLPGYYLEEREDQIRNRNRPAGR